MAKKNELNLSDTFRHLTPEQGAALAVDTVLCNEQQAAVMLGLSVITLRQWRQQRKGPDYAKAGRRVLYPLKSLKNYIRNLPVVQCGK